MAQNNDALSMQEVMRMESCMQLELVMLCLKKSEGVNEFQVSYI